MAEGLIVKSTGSWYEVRATDGERLRGRLRGKFKIKGLKVTNPLAVGDYVVYTPEPEVPDQVIITDIMPRQNYLVRQSPRKQAHGHLIATNLDQAVLIVTLVQPRTSPGFIDRFLVSAEAFRIPAFLVFNKQDLLGEKGRAAQAELCAAYEEIGYPCLLTSVTTGEGVEAFDALLEGKKTLLSGHSGVGKSSLVNAVAPGLSLRTAELSSFANKGKHTTTFAEMFELRPDTFIIDTPGIKELGLAEIAPNELSHYFPEMRAYLNACRYHNCTHTHEPGCAVVDALDAGQIDPSRYYSYLSMLENDDNRR